MRGLLTEVHFGGSFYTRVPVSGKPFRTDFEEIHIRKSPRGFLRVSGTLCRDSLGRRRRDYTRNSDQENVPDGIGHSSIADPSLGLSFVLDDKGECLAKFPDANIEGQNVCSTESVTFDPSNEGLTNRSHKSLGQKSIEGFICDGLLSESSEETTELWISRDLLEVLLRIQRGAAGEISYRLFKIELVEPETAIFDVLD